MLTRVWSDVFPRLPILFVSLALGLATSTSVYSYSSGASYEATCNGCHTGPTSNTSTVVSAGTLRLFPGDPLKLNVAVSNSAATSASFDMAIFDSNNINIGANKNSVTDTFLIQPDQLMLPAGDTSVKISYGEFTHTARKPVANGAANFGFTWNTPKNIPLGSYTIKTAGLTPLPQLSGENSTQRRERAEWSRGNNVTVTFVTPALPGAPVGVSASPGNGQATVNFSAANSTDVVNGYTVTASPGGITATGTASPITVTELINDNEYTFTVKATNSAGQSGASASSSAVTPTAPPAVATGVRAVAGNLQATVSFTAPVAGATGYTVASVPGDITATGTASPITVTGLTNFAKYRFTVTPQGAGGVASLPSNEIIPNPNGWTVPDQPNAAGANGGNRMAVIAVSQPNDGGTPITSYTAICNFLTGVGVPLTFTASTSTRLLVITGLNNGTTYKCGLTATNAIGTSIAPNPEFYGIQFVPFDPGPPGVPTSIAAAPSNTQAIVSFLPPANDGGSPILDYTAYCQAKADFAASGNRSTSLTKTGATSPLTVTGLTNGNAYDCWVSARNAIGSFFQFQFYPDAVSVTPANITVPGAPTGVTAVADEGRATVSFTAPASNGGSPITAYNVTSNPAGFSSTGNASPITITGLAGGTAYTFTVTAFNAAGASTGSVASSAVTPAAAVVIPAAPTGVVASVTGGNLITTSWAAVAGATSYNVYMSNAAGVTKDNYASLTGGHRHVGATSPFAPHPGAPGTAYYMVVTALNSAGESAISVEVSATVQPTATVPAAPTGIVGSITGGNLITTSWAGVGGATSYNVYMANAAGVTKDNYASLTGGHRHVGATSPFAPHPGSVGVPYFMVVTALNSAGESASSAEVSATVPTSTSSTTSTSTTTSTSSTTSTSTTTSSTTTTTQPVTLSVAAGWNLVGNSSSTALDVATAFGDTAKTLTVWKWVASTTKWAFYAPSLVGQQLIDYAASKGYDVLATINRGEGFWVNAKLGFTTTLPAGAPVTSASFQSLVSGWSLNATGDNKTPSQFNLLISTVPPSVGDIPVNLTTLWAWDAGLTNWYFYAPSLEKNGGLSSYVTSKSYLDFGTKTLSPTTGFWVNKP